MFVVRVSAQGNKYPRAIVIPREAIVSLTIRTYGGTSRNPHFHLHMSITNGAPVSSLFQGPHRSSRELAEADLDYVLTSMEKGHATVVLDPEENINA